MALYAQLQEHALDQPTGKVTHMSVLYSDLVGYIITDGVSEAEVVKQQVMPSAQAVQNTRASHHECATPGHSPHSLPVESCTLLVALGASSQGGELSKVICRGAREVPAVSTSNHA